MKQPTSPPPLKAGPDTPAELKRALRALGKQDTHPARFERVASRLGDLLDAPPPASFEAAALLRHASRKVLATRLVVAALTIGTSAVVWLNVSPRAARTPVAQHASAVERVPAAQAQLDAPSAPVAAFARTEAPAPATPPSTEPTVELPTSTSSRLAASAPQGHVSKRASSARATRGRRARTADKLAAASATLRSASTAAELTTPVATDTSTPAEQAASAPAGQSAAPQTARAAPAATRAAPAPTRAPPELAHARTEVELLFEARQQVRRHPERALVLLEEHAARFGAGLLAPEREVLAIEALRKLGQAKAAAQRLRSFRARYPDSIHLRRLAREQP